MEKMIKEVRKNIKKKRNKWEVVGPVIDVSGFSELWEVTKKAHYEVCLGLQDLDDKYSASTKFVLSWTTVGDDIAIVCYGR